VFRTSLNGTFQEIFVGQERCVCVCVIREEAGNCHLRFAFVTAFLAETQVCMWVYVCGPGKP